MEGGVSATDRDLLCFIVFYRSSQIEPTEGQISVIVLCHTRELAFQIAHEYERFSKYLLDVKTAVFYGGLWIERSNACPLWGAKMLTRTICPGLQVCPSSRTVRP